MTQKFLARILEEVFDRAHDPESGSIRLSALTSVLFEYLEDAGVFDSPEVAYYRFERGNVSAEVHGYACDTEDDVISLFYCVDSTVDEPLGQASAVRPTGKDLLDRAFRRLEAFVKIAQSGRIPEIEESQPARELVALLQEAVRDGRTIELQVLTTGTVTDRAASSGAKGMLRREIWDLLRLERVCGTGGDGSITIDFPAEFQKTLPCLVTPKSADGLQVLLTCIPGEMLGEIYNTHRTALLERNVRSFLQFTGKVNKGIRTTILTEPQRFLPYNNGLSATAGEVELDVLEGGLGQIRVVRDFQIVNGGQTTASIASCARRDRADLRAVAVPMKLTVVPRELLDGLVPKISRFANTQNRIQDADFSANDPWHIALERLSRSLWTRATTQSPRGTRWFYERSRGQYTDGVSSAATPAGRKQFRAENPAAQKFTKTDLAKFLMSWDQFPATVSRGAQKCFMAFMSQMATIHRKTPDEAEFRRIVSLAILFRTAERLYGEMEFQGYRANVVTYAIARLSHECSRHLDAEAIWREQSVPVELGNALKLIITGVREIIANPPSTHRNVTEWAKRDECWSAVLERPFELDVGQTPDDRHIGNGAATAPSLAPGQQNAVEVLQAVPADVWFATSAWAKQTSSLQPWQRSLSYSLGRLAASSKAPSIKQTVQGRRLLLEANRLGFRHDGLNAGILDSLRLLPDT